MKNKVLVRIFKIYKNGRYIARQRATDSYSAICKYCAMAKVSNREDYIAKMDI